MRLFQTRRQFLQLGAAATVGSLLPLSRAGAAETVREYKLVAAKSKVQLANPPFPATGLWCFNGQTPGPQIRLRLGERVRIVAENQLDEITSVHWHGLRLENEMDGIAFLTQPPIEKGERFVYEFTPPDAGTFWYHSHENAAVQQGRGLDGAFIVEEIEPPKVDRDLVWMLDDWRLDENAQITEDFDSIVDYSRAGRIGNTVTLNGRAAGELRVRAGERVRLRMVNTANARIFRVVFTFHKPRIIALDGQPTEPFVPPFGYVELAPGQRADVILDMEGKPGERFQVVDSAFLQNPYKLAEIVYEDGKPLRESPLDASIRLPSNPVLPPDLTGEPFQKDVPLEGGDLGRLRSAYLEGQQRGVSELLLNGKFWAVCGVSAFRQVMPPFATVERGRTCVFRLQNRSVWPHTMHTHGHTFKVISHPTQAYQEGRYLDTVLLGPEEEVTIAFVADNPGDWLFHCHMLSHAYAGMLATFRVL